MGKSDHLVFIMDTKKKKKKKSHSTQSKSPPIGNWFIKQSKVYEGSYTAIKNDNMKFYI